MAVNHWSLERLIVWIGTISLLAMCVPMGLYLTHSVSSSVEHCLSERGKSLASTLVGQIVEPILLKDRVAVQNALLRVVAIDDEIRYLCIEDEQGRITAHTFKEGYPTELTEIWKAQSGPTSLFRTAEDRLINFSYPILDGQLGTLHVGISRLEAVKTTGHLLWLMGAGLGAALFAVFTGSRLVAMKVSKPLRELEATVSLFPQQGLGEKGIEASGTREVRSLANGFADMVVRLKSLERDRALTQDRMIHAERLAAVGELAAGLAHEIHNPLDGMQECLRYLEEDPDKSGRAKKYYPMFRDGLQRIARVMREMLMFVHFKQSVVIEESRVTDVLAALELLVGANMRSRNVRLSWRIIEDCTCVCDPRGLSQAGLNLILNAADAVEGEGNPEIQVEAKCNARWVYLAFDDSGSGVPEDLRERIFDMFFTTKPPGKGTGIGLSVSREMMRAVGGELELSPQPSFLGGAQFVIRLPRAIPSEYGNGCDPSENTDR